MRLETCIRKGLRLKAHRVREVREEADRLVAEIEWIPGRALTCGHGARRTQRVHSRRPMREWRDLSVRDQVLVLRYAPYRVRCPACGPRVEHVPWAHKWQRITRALARALAQLSRRLSWQETATHYGVNWKTVATAVERAVQWGLQHRRWKPLHFIGIGEVSRRKGHRYLTLVHDLARRCLVWAGENRDAATMQQFFAWLGRGSRGAAAVDSHAPRLRVARPRAALRRGARDSARALSSSGQSSTPYPCRSPTGPLPKESPNDDHGDHRSRSENPPPPLEARAHARHAPRARPARAPAADAASGFPLARAQRRSLPSRQPRGRAARPAGMARSGHAPRGVGPHGEGNLRSRAAERAHDAAVSGGACWPSIC